MPRVIIDTNIIVSGFVFGGKVKQILTLVFEGDLEMAKCEELETESLRILISKFNVSFKVLTAVKRLFKISKTYELKKPYPQISRDKNDNFLLALVEVSKAKILITGDKDLLVLKEYKGCKIMKPGEFLEWLDNSEIDKKFQASLIQKLDEGEEIPPFTEKNAKPFKWNSKK